jgi:hypothetical protein
MARLPRSKKGMRIAIAMDVIAQLKDKENPLEAQTGSYISVGDIESAIITPKRSYEISKIIPKIRQTCTVCALGSLLLAEIAMNNEFKCKLNDLDNKFLSSIDKRLIKYFDRRQLALIEVAFELESHLYDLCTIFEVDEDYDYDYYNGDCDISEYVIDKEYHRAVRFGEKYSDDSKRLMAIMKNIVKNEGTFKP